MGLYLDLDGQIGQNSAIMEKASAILANLPGKLKEARRQKALTLEAAAKLSGVSKSMLSQIERGESSPTISTLWNLTRALQVDFAGLLETNDKGSQIDLLRADDAPVISVNGSGYQIRILSPPEEAGKQEVYELTLSPDSVMDSQPHSSGAREHLTVMAGHLTVKSGESEEDLKIGDTARYAADVPHVITAQTTSKAILIVTNS